jgi:hypothetical protein
MRQRLEHVMSTTIAAILALVFSAPAAPPRGPAVAQTSFDFGAVQQGAKVEHEFAIENHGTAPLRIERVALTPPLVVRRMPESVAPGGRGLLGIELPTGSIAGSFTGAVVVLTDAPAKPRIDLEITGRVIPPVEVLPMRAAFLVGTRRTPATTSLEIVNREEHPIRIEGVEHARGAFTTRVETIEQGRRWRLVLSLLPDGPAGKRSERVTVRTTSHAAPTVTILAHTYLRERVYTFPDTVDLGTLPLSALKKDASRLAQTLMVYQVDGTDFHARLTADLPFLRLHSERGPKRDRFQATITVAPDEVKPGPIQGSISIETNDPAFPRLDVPVTGTILE